MFTSRHWSFCFLWSGKPSLPPSFHFPPSSFLFLSLPPFFLPLYIFFQVRSLAHTGLELPTWLKMTLNSWWLIFPSAGITDVYYHTQFRQNQDKSQSLLHTKSLYQFSYVPVLVLETESYYMTQVGLKLMSLLPRSPKYWDYRHEPSYVT